MEEQIDITKTKYFDNRYSLKIELIEEEVIRISLIDRIMPWKSKTHDYTTEALHSICKFWVDHKLNEIYHCIYYSLFPYECIDKSNNNQVIEYKNDYSNSKIYLQMMNLGKLLDVCFDLSKSNGLESWNEDKILEEAIRIKEELELEIQYKAILKKRSTLS